MKNKQYDERRRLTDRVIMITGISKHHHLVAVFTSTMQCNRRPLHRDDTMITQALDYDNNTENTSFFIGMTCGEGESEQKYYNSLLSLIKVCRLSLSRWLFRRCCFESNMTAIASSVFNFGVRLIYIFVFNKSLKETLITAGKLWLQHGLIVGVHTLLCRGLLYSACGTTLYSIP